jgi:hypothetical protein
MRAVVLVATAQILQQMEQTLGISLFTSDLLCTKSYGHSDPRVLQLTLTLQIHHSRQISIITGIKDVNHCI